MNLDEQLIDEEEGPSSPTVYPDSRGFSTICRGTLVDRRVKGSGLCQAAIAAQDAYTLALARKDAQAIAGYWQANEVRQAVLTSMCFQLGPLTGWPGFRAAFAAGQYDLAANQMLYRDGTNPAAGRSDWHLQTPGRCERAARMMRDGVWVDHA